MIGNQHSFFQIVEDHHPRATPESAKRLLMEFRPDACIRTPGQQAYGFAAVAEGENEQSRPAILATLRVAHHRATAVIDLRFFSCCSEDDARRFGKLRPSKLANKTLHGLIAARKPVIGNEVLPDGHGIPATNQSLLDQLAIWFTGTGGPIGMVDRRSLAPRRRARVGGHLYGRFCRVGGHLIGRFCWRLAVPTRPADAPRSRLLSGKRRRFLDGHRWLARCAAKAIRASPVR